MYFIQIDLLTPWLYGPRTALATLNTGAHSSLSTAVCHRLLTFISRRSFSTSSTHINLGLPLLPLPSGLFSDIFLTVLTCSILIACPIHPNFFFLISVTTSISLYNSPSSSLVLILQIPCSATVPVSLLFSSPMYPAFSYPSQPQPMFQSHTLQLVSPSLYIP